MAQKNNLAAVLHGKDDIKLENFPIKAPGKFEVQLSMTCVGICGSDVHYWKNGRIGDFILTAPMVLGHEAAGTVVSLGDGVSDLKIGDRVAVEPGVPCRMCEFCKSGSYNLCADVKFCATPPYHGNLCQFYNHPADFCYKLPDNVSNEEGALLEPLSVAVHACRRANLSIGDIVLVCGAGPIGLVNVLTAKAMGAATVIVTDIDEKRLALAKALGADKTLKVPRDVQETVALIKKKLGGRQPNVTIECSGAEASLQTGILATRAGGRVVTVGRGPPDARLPIHSASKREVDILGLFRYCNVYPTALSMVASGQVNVKPLVTHHFNLKESEEAFKVSHAGLGVKVMIHCDRA